VSLKQVSRITNYLINRSMVWPMLFFILLVLLEITYYTIRGSAGDFPVFYGASKAVLSLDNPWESIVDPVFSAYLNGPITALIISPLGLLPQHVALLIIRLISLALIPVLVWHLSKLVQPKHEITLLNKKNWLISALVILTFPVRANLEYGQFFIIFITAATIAITLAQSQLPKNLFAAGFILGVCCDYKPQAFVIFVILFCFKNKLIFLGSCLSVLIGTFTSVILTRKIPYLEWAESILIRVDGGMTSEQMNIYVVVPKVLSVFITIAIVITLVLNRHKFFCAEIDKQLKYLIVIFIFTLLSPWMHSTDLVLFPIFAISLVVQRTMFSYIGAFSLGTMLVWSNNIVISLLIALAASTLILLIVDKKLKKKVVQFLLISLPSLIFSITANVDLNLEDLHRKYWGLMSLITITIMALLTLLQDEPKVENVKSN
jgi:hypothetical protein